MVILKAVFPLKNYQCMEVGVPVSQNARLSDSDTEDPRRGASRGWGVGMAGPMGLVKNEKVVKKIQSEMMVHSLLLYLFKFSLSLQILPENDVPKKHSISDTIMMCPLIVGCCLRILMEPG